MIFVLLVCPLHKWVPKCDITFFFSFFVAGWWGDMRKATYKSYRRAMQFWCVFMIRKITWILTKKRTNENIIWRCNRNDDVNKPWHPNLCKHLSIALCVTACVSLMLVQRISSCEKHSLEHQVYRLPFQFWTPGNYINLGLRTIGLNEL